MKMCNLDYFYYCLTNQSFLETLQRRAENRIGSFPQITFDLLGDYRFLYQHWLNRNELLQLLQT